MDVRRPFSCDFCGKAFKKRGDLNVHVRVHTGEKPYSCDICERKFSDTSSLSKHKKIHTGERPYECDICEKTFNKKNNLAQHKRIHTGEKPYACDICQKYFTAISGLIVHSKTSIHLNKKKDMELNSASHPNMFIDCGELIKVEIKEEESDEPVSVQQIKECDICNKTFNTNRNLADHRRIHTGEKPYECEICKESFSRTSNLHQHNKTLAHLKRKQAIEEIKEGERVQDSVFIQQNEEISDGNNLTYRERLLAGENPYVCDICDKTFTKSSNLASHRRTHTGERPYECDICKKAFSTNRSLAEHTRIHTGDKPYECSICKENFSRSSTLYKHNKTIAHLKRKQAIEENSSSNPNMFIDCGELIKVEIKEEVIDEDSITIQNEEIFTSNSVTCDSLNPHDITGNSSDKNNVNKVNNLILINDANS